MSGGILQYDGIHLYFFYKYQTHSLEKMAKKNHAKQKPGRPYLSWVLCFVLHPSNYVVFFPLGLSWQKSITSSKTSAYMTTPDNLPSSAVMSRQRKPYSLRLTRTLPNQYTSIFSAALHRCKCSPQQQREMQSRSCQCTAFLLPGSLEKTVKIRTSCLGFCFLYQGCIFFTNPGSICKQRAKHRLSYMIIKTNILKHLNHFRQHFKGRSHTGGKEASLVEQDTIKNKWCRYGTSESKGWAVNETFLSSMIWETVEQCPKGIGVRSSMAWVTIEWVELGKGIHPKGTILSCLGCVERRGNYVPHWVFSFSNESLLM